MIAAPVEIANPEAARPRRTPGPRACALALALVLVGLALAPPAPARAASPEGQMTWAVHVSLAPLWFDPADTPTLVTPFMIFYAIHDALVKPMPGQAMAPSLAESWTASADGLNYDFVLRKGPKFHTGDPVTADDVKFSFERYRGGAASTLKQRVASVEVLDPQRVRFRLKQPWPDFMTYFGTTATGAGWIVPRKYVEKVGDDGFKKAPMGAGPYKFVSFTPGVELVLEAYEGYWRKMPSVKRLVFKVVPDEATRFAMLKRGEAEISYLLRGSLGEDLQKTPGYQLKAPLVSTTIWLVFPDQWDPKSPWHDRRVRLAANLAIDRKGMNQAEYLGFARVIGSIIPATFDFSWQAPLYPHDPAKARQLLAEAGYPKGFDAGEYFCDASTSLAEPIINDLNAVGIKAQLRPLERASFFSQFQQKKLKNIIQALSGAFGNAATRIEAFVAAGGAYVSGSYPDIDGLFREQAGERDRKKREALLQKIQQLMHEKAMFAPIWQNAVLSGIGPRVAEPGIGLIAEYPFSAPYEDVKLKAK
jgi:peptide/nickel transport system substrate-binding protein